MKKLRVTFLVCNPDLSGGNRIIAEHARLLKNAGHKVNVIGVDIQEHSARSIARSLVKKRQWPTSQICTQHFDAADVSITVVKNVNGPQLNDIPDADIIIATWWLTAEWIRDLPASKGQKVHFIQGYEPLFSSVADPARVRATYRFPFFHIGVSKWLCEQIHEQYLPTRVPKECVLVENGIDLKNFDAPVRGRQKSPTVGYMYSSAGFKNPSLALESLKCLKAERPETKFIIFGGQDLNNEHILPADCEFIKRPSQREIPSIYARCDAWLLTSDHEGFGLPIIEAMACRTPVVATRAGISTDIVNVTNGVLCEQREPEAIANAIEQILKLPDRDWRLHSKYARRTAEQFTWERAGTKFERALYQALGISDPLADEL